MLNGNAQEFRELSFKRGSFYFNIYGGVDDYLDCPNDDFRMTTLFCEGETDPKVVWQVGYELISLFNGASVLFSKDYRKVSIFKLLNQETTINFMPDSGITALLGKPEVEQERIDQEYENSLNLGVKFSLIHLATENKDVYFILKYLDMDSNWTTYYKLMEAIETFATEKEINLGITKRERTAFTNTANNFSLSGFDSRHGFKEITKKNNTAVMSIDEGYLFVTKMAKAYLKKIYFNED